ncbi:TetR/AcrR family transcriptional regulator [Spiractinospora alimapuensis]|uniref:TetR/AcrR family transcriptional regulator n=1 Tax=Spiractinospora alimapuensis TaxID=2820884 RepID=UPI001F3A19EA|nr:TetR/AcrR family transcriptional regulator [Spiractinospora alimapuensis]QVQ50869.1 TetR/AcrR family transcriptional regulator [Spiractinospora alimapuensis]
MSDRAIRILTAAAALFVRYGVAKTTVDDIATEAGVSKGAVYLEFSGKDALVEALVRHEFRTYLEAAAARVDSDPRGGHLSRVYYHSLEELARRPMLRALYTRDSDVLGTLVRRGGAARHAPRLLLGRDFVERMQAAGLVRAELDPAVLSHSMGVLSVGFLMAQPVLADGTEPPLPETVGMLADMITSLAEPSDTTTEGDTPSSEAGKAAFADLCRQLVTAIER